MLFSIGFSMVSYFVLTVVLDKYPYQLEEINYVAYLVNQALAIVYIFYGLFLIKTENQNYNRALHETNDEITRQSQLLKEQAEQLDQLNTMQTKLFSVISHDLKAPMYALRNLFAAMELQKMPAKDIKAFIPDVQKDLNYTVGLMENLLNWAKSQMKSHHVHAQALDVDSLLTEVSRVLNLQADAKNIKIVNTTEHPVLISADRDMISLVIRNLLSNAIKFSPPGSTITIGASEMSSYADIYIQDTGKGIGADELKKINSQEFFTTNGTAHEQGTGLGLMLCREFLSKNGGKLRIESETGKGSRFSFTLPKAEIHAIDA
jgi:signal transduction histidine kinase